MVQGRKIPKHEDHLGFWIGRKTACRGMEPPIRGEGVERWERGAGFQYISSNNSSISFPGVHKAVPCYVLAKSQLDNTQPGQIVGHKWTSLKLYIKVGNIPSLIYHSTHWLGWLGLSMSHIPAKEPFQPSLASCVLFLSPCRSPFQSGCPTRP